MASITLKNIPDPTYEILKQLASQNHRSINSEVIFLIEKATKSTKIDAKQHLVVARELREKTKDYVLDDTLLNQIRNEGRL
ncbi:Arc family DNA-binding protein [uncultured Desulfobacter sp.]|uniref:FitA-like ribbon-helix-helix domain-containing protein n=1 Tax=uncultured Desulfobacter sp. TaxID=240139 RepID=UPI0029F586BE|nr:Arc family DNA-binding protein [uncultured Desulfobacter sp.]